MEVRVENTVDYVRGSSEIVHVAREVITMMLIYKRQFWVVGLEPFMCFQASGPHRRQTETKIFSWFSLFEQTILDVAS